MDLKSIDALLKLCRKHGVLTLKTNEIEFALSERHSPIANRKSRSAKTSVDASPAEPDAFNFEDLDEEQKLFWSSLPNSSDPKENS